MIQRVSGGFPENLFLRSYYFCGFFFGPHSPLKLRNECCNRPVDEGIKKLTDDYTRISCGSLHFSSVFHFNDRRKTFFFSSLLFSFFYQEHYQSTVYITYIYLGKVGESRKTTAKQAINRLNRPYWITEPPKRMKINKRLKSKVAFFPNSGSGLLDLMRNEREKKKKKIYIYREKKDAHFNWHQVEKASAI